MVSDCEEGIAKKPGEKSEVKKRVKSNTGQRINSRFCGYLKGHYDKCKFPKFLVLLWHLTRWSKFEIW